jgi:ribosomal protein S12 methylthiotransferase
MENQIEQSVMIIRQEKIMLTQNKISEAKNQEMVGRELEIVIDGYVPSEEVYLGRSYKDTPDVDGYVFIESETELLSGDYIMVRITGANDYDLIGERI